MATYTPDRRLLGTVVSVAATLAVAGILVAAVTDNAVLSTLSGVVVGASCVAGVFAAVLLIRSYVGGRRPAAATGPAAGAATGLTAETTATSADQDTLDSLEPLQAARRADPR